MNSNQPSLRSNLGPCKGRGFTLIEALVVITILGILAALAPPSFDYIVVSSRTSSFASNLAASMQLARSESILRNTPVSVCASANKTTCSGDWDQGWIVLSAAGVLRAEQGPPSGWEIFDSQENVLKVDFDPTGVGATQALFFVYRNSPPSNVQRCVRVSATGTATVLTRRSDGSCT